MLANISASTLLTHTNARRMLLSSSRLYGVASKGRLAFLRLLTRCAWLYLVLSFASASLATQHCCREALCGIRSSPSYSRTQIVSAIGSPSNASSTIETPKRNTRVTGGNASVATTSVRNCWIASTNIHSPAEPSCIRSSSVKPWGVGTSVEWSVLKNAGVDPAAPILLVYRNRSCRVRKRKRPASTKTLHQWRHKAITKK